MVFKTRIIASIYTFISSKLDEFIKQAPKQGGFSIVH